MSSNAATKINDAAGQAPENATASKEHRFAEGEFSLVLTHPSDVKMPEDVLRLVTGITRKLSEMARRRASLST
jgi:hypothetical protein